MSQHVLSEMTSCSAGVVTIERFSPEWMGKCITTPTHPIRRPPHCPPLCHITKPQYVWGRWTGEDQETGDGRMQMAAAYYGDRLLIDARLN